MNRWRSQGYDRPYLRWGTGAAVFLLVLMPVGGMSWPDQDEAREVMRGVIDQAIAEDEVVDAVMRLIDSKGRVRQRTATLYIKKSGAQTAKRLIRFHTPADLAHSGVLTLENADREADQWIYLPAYHSTRRIASANRRDTYLGTDFAYEDITGPKIQHYRYRMLVKEWLRDVLCTVIEATPVDERSMRESGYQKVIYWIDPGRHLALKADFYDRSGTLMKTMTNSNLERSGGYYRWRNIEMHQLKRGHRTMLEFSERKMNQGLSNEWFTLRYLERGW